MRKDAEKAIEEAASALLRMRVDNKEVDKRMPLPTRQGPERRYKIEVNRSGKPKIREVG